MGRVQWQNDGNAIFTIGGKDMTHIPKVLYKIDSLTEMLLRIKYSDDFKSNMTLMAKLIHEVAELGISLEKEAKV